MKKFIMILLALIILATPLITSCGQNKKNKLEEAAKLSSYAKLSADKLSIICDNSKYTNVDYIKEINKTLGFPDSVWEKMLKTRALDGTQSHKTKDFTATWSYHPDNGLDVIYEIND